MLGSAGFQPADHGVPPGSSEIACGNLPFPDAPCRYALRGGPCAGRRLRDGCRHQLALRCSASSTPRTPLSAGNPTIPRIPHKIPARNQSFLLRGPRIRKNPRPLEKDRLLTQPPDKPIEMSLKSHRPNPRDRRFLCREQGAGCRVQGAGLGRGDGVLAVPVLANLGDF
jgi:hypothetical protein